MEIKKNKQYNLDYITAFDGLERKRGVGERRVYHDVSLKKWRLTIQLDEKAYWFLSVYFGDDGKFDKYSLDYEGDSDSHYEFKEEKGIRDELYIDDDENRYYDEILSRYVKEHGGWELHSLLEPYITAQYHFD